MSINEQWDIVSGVGVTALAVAAGRAVETRHEQGLVDDPYAAALVAAADSPLSAALHPAGSDPTLTEMAPYLGIRSHFFDTWFERACANGIRQAVILASGLDTRPFRLTWPSGTRVFEIDQPKVLDFKDSVLREEGARPSCERHAIGVDLREDWATALKNAGFDTGTPTAWLAEGLLPYLPAAAEEDLLAAVHSFSAPGSRIAIENIGGVRAQLGTSRALLETSRRWGIDLAALIPDEDRPDPTDRLRDQGWTVSSETLTDLAAGHGRELGGVVGELCEHARMLTADLPG